MVGPRLYPQSLDVSVPGERPLLILETDRSAGDLAFIRWLISSSCAGQLSLTGHIPPLFAAFLSAPFDLFPSEWY